MFSIRRVLSFRLLQGWLIFIVALALGACGGTTTEPSGSSAGVGSVGIVLTDAPSDEFQHIWMTVQEVLLLPADDDGRPVSIFSGEQTVDLLSLRDHAELFALEDVPAGRYEKIRLILKRPNGLELVTLDGVSHSPKLPGNGKLDLNPRGGFHVTSGETLYLQIDVDADKSIHAHQTGNGRYQFRPVVFVDIIDGQFSGKLVRRTGYVEALADDASRFALCDGASILPIVKTDDDDGNDDGNSDDNYMACLRIVTADASLFGADGLPVALTDLTEGEWVTVVGFLRRSLGDGDDDDGDDGDDDRHHDGDRHHDDEEDGDDYAKYATLYAEVIEVLSEVDGFETVKGTVANEPADALSQFALTLGNDSELAIQLQDGTKVFARDGSRLSAADILAGTVASVDGVRADDGSGGELLLASLVILDTTATTTAERIMGTVNSANPETRTLDVATTTTNGDVIVPVQLEADALILLLGDFEDGARSESSDFAALTEGRQVEIYGRAGALGFFVAQVVLITD